MFPTPGYSLYPRPFDVSAGATLPRLLDTPRSNLSHGFNVKAQWRFHWKWHLLLKCAGGRWNINFIKYVYSGLCTWSILIMLAHRSLDSCQCKWGSATEGGEDSSLCPSRLLHFHLNRTSSSIREVCLHIRQCFYLHHEVSVTVQYMLQWWSVSGLFWRPVCFQCVRVAVMGGPALRSASAATTAPATPSMAPASAFLAG